MEKNDAFFFFFFSLCVSLSLFSLDHRMSWLVTATFLLPSSLFLLFCFSGRIRLRRCRSRTRRRREKKSFTQSVMPEDAANFADWLVRACKMPEGMIGQKQQTRKETSSKRTTVELIKFIRRNIEKRKLIDNDERFHNFDYLLMIYLFTFLIANRLTWFFSKQQKEKEKEKENFASSKANKKEIGHHQIDRRHCFLSTIFFSRSGWFSLSRFSRSLSLILSPFFFLHCAFIDVTTKTHTHT